ncbi:MAG: right-handed parallel beta-helix repeat-containing protein [Phycisphaerae bacterium]|nr:right-handed parallel beta-helix repeat-containing protein [Phycisphaerae bacterium]
MNTRSVIGTVVLLAAMGASAQPACGATYHVAASGNDAAQGTAEAPWQTLARAIDAAAAGDTILLAEGSYEFALPKKKLDGRMLTIRAVTDAANKVTVTGLKTDYDGRYSFLRFEGLAIPNPVRIHKARWVQFVRCRFSGASHWGVGLMECENAGVYGCNVATDTDSQIMMGGLKKAEFRFNEVTQGTSDAFQGNGDDILIEGNWVHDMRRKEGAHADGLQLGNTRRLTVRGNLFECPDMQTLFLSWTKKETTYEDIVIENNICITAQVHGLTVTPSTDLTIRNNLIICDPKHKYSTQTVNLGNLQGKVTLQNNLLHLFGMAKRDQDVVAANLVMKKHWAKDNWGSELPVVDPETIFVDRSARDFRLKEGSPALGAAVPGTVPPRDILGRDRPKDKPSIGPLERLPEDKPFMEMWRAYFLRMQAEVRPSDPQPEPPAAEPPAATPTP